MTAARPRVLVALPGAESGRALAAFLDANGFDVVTVQDTESALNALGREHVDLAGGEADTRGMRALVIVLALWGCGSTVNNTDGGDDDAPPGDTCGAGAVSEACVCGGREVESGYCCDHAWQMTACFEDPLADILDPDRITTWNPGILHDDQLGMDLGADGLPVRSTVCATLQPGGNIQAAIDACPEGQVVQLAPGTFTIASTVTLTRGVVLRGSGSQGAPTGTTIMKTGGRTVLAIGTTRDTICWSWVSSIGNLARDSETGSASRSVYHVDE